MLSGRKPIEMIHKRSAAQSHVWFPCYSVAFIESVGIMVGIVYPGNDWHIALLSTTDLELLIVCVAYIAVPRSLFFLLNHLMISQAWPNHLHSDNLWIDQKFPFSVYWSLEIVTFKFSFHIIRSFSAFCPETNLSSEILIMGVEVVLKSFHKLTLGLKEFSVDKMKWHHWVKIENHLNLNFFCVINVHL